METKARLIDVSKDWTTGNLRVMFQLAYDVSEEQLNSLSNKDLRLKAVRWTEKRSLNANAYAWELMTQLAHKLRTTKEEIYEAYVRDMGIPDEDENGPIEISVRGDVSIDRLPGHWIFLRNWYGIYDYKKIKGSSEYNTVEMARLIDLIVDDCKEQGIDTRTPDEIERMVQEWGVV